MSLKPIQCSLVLLALAPLFRANADDLLLAQARTPISTRPTRTPIRPHIVTNTPTDIPTTQSNALGKPFGAPHTATTTTTPGTPPGFPPIGVPAAKTPSATTPQSTLPGAAGPGVAPGAVAMQPGAIVNPDDVPTYDYNFIATPIEQILDEYADLVNRTVLRANNGASMVAPGTLITLKTRPGHKLTRREAILALETVLGMNGITVVPIGEKFLKVVPDAVAGQQGGAFYSGGASNLPDAGRFITQIIQLKYASAQDVTQALMPFSKTPNSIIVIPSTQTVILRDYAENVKRMMEVLEKIDVSSPMEVKPEVIPIKYALASDIANALSSLSGGGGGTVSVGSHQTGGGLGASHFGGAGGGGFGGGGIGGTGSSYGPGGMNPGGQPSYGTGAQGTSSLASPGTTTRSSFQNNLAKIIRNAAASGGPGGGEFQIIGETKIVADERTNSLLIFANEQDMKMIKLIISKLDVVLAQVLIEAIIVDVALTKSRDVSVSYLTKGSTSNGKIFAGNNNLSGNAQSFLNNAGTINSGSNTLNLTDALTGLPSGLSVIGQFNNFDVAVQAIQSDSRATILSRPRIQTSHAVPALLFNGQTIPYITGSYYGGYNGGLGSSQYTEKEIGISLEVLPLINPDGLVVMDIRQNIEEVTGTTKIDQNDVPITSKRQAEAKVAVKDRETVILGGFIRSTKSKSSSGIPILKDIPGLGILFRSSSMSADQDELIVLIRPTVLPTPEIASKFAAEERDRLSGVKQGERDLRIEEEERYRKIEEQLQKDEEIRRAREERDAKKHQAHTEAYHYDNSGSFMTNKPVTTPDL